MTDLFDTTQINGMTLANRFVRSATWEGMAADDGTVTSRLIDTVTHLAEGGIGLINRWRSGDTRPALCKSDNRCFRPALKGEGIYCVTEQRERPE
ncbi:MAG: hypothetical protein R6U16_02945 [Desulfotignum sp.]